MLISEMVPVFWTGC